jgi:hypothetical protein
MTPKPERARVTEEGWGKIFPYDHEAIIYERGEDEEGPEGDELEWPDFPEPVDDIAELPASGYGGRTSSQQNKTGGRLSPLGDCP